MKQLISRTKMSFICMISFIYSMFWYYKRDAIVIFYVMFCFRYEPNWSFMMDVYFMIRFAWTRSCESVTDVLYSDMWPVGSKNQREWFNHKLNHMDGRVSMLFVVFNSTFTFFTISKRKKHQSWNTPMCSLIPRDGAMQMASTITMCFRQSHDTSSHSTQLSKSPFFFDWCLFAVFLSFWDWEKTEWVTASPQATKWVQSSTPTETKNRGMMRVL